MRKLALICGGTSGEHEISLISAKHLQRAIDSENFETHVIVIERSGAMKRVELSELDALSDQPDSKVELKGEPVSFSKNTLHIGKKELSIDLAFPLLHGEGGEDGKIQGWLETLHIPYVGSGVKASALGMDKALTKVLARDVGVPVVPFQKFRVGAQFSESETIFPLFVKPTTAGSSLGVTKVRHWEDLLPAAEKAWTYSLEAMIEPAIEGREIEIALLDDGEDRKASVAGEIRCRDSVEFYSYEAKYVHADAAELIAPAEISEKELARLTELAWKCFDSLGCRGLARVDFFLHPKEGFLLNEINTMPGFTPISMYPRLLQLSGLSYPDLVSRLLRSARLSPKA